MAVHVITHGLQRVTAEGALMPARATIQDRMNFDIQDRVFEDANVPNSVGNPTVADYIIAEEGSGFVFLHMDQTYIITRSS